MGVFQNIAALAGNSTQIRPVDILSAGQQGMQQVQAGLQGITGQMAENRKLDAQQRADTAVSNLLKEAPKGTTDPTQFNQALGLASAYGSQGIKDVARNAIQSATEGYRTALQQENFGKEQKLREDTLQANIENNQAMQALRGQELSNNYEHQKAVEDYNKKNLEITAKYQAGQLSVSQANLAIQKNNADWNKKIATINLESQGYVQDKNGNFKFDMSSPKFILSQDNALISDYVKSRPTPDKFRELGHTRDIFGGYLTSESRYLDAFNQADKFLLTPTSDPKGLIAKQQVRSLLESGDYNGIEKLFNKTK